jgi:thymidylate synthase
MHIREANPVEAWRSASRHLCGHGKQDYNMLVQFPCNAADETQMPLFDPRSTSPRLDRIRDVANTIFPSRTWANSGGNRATFYERYGRAHRRGRRKSWGTYFGRFIDFGEAGVNQLERLIKAHDAWPGSYRAAFFMHTSSAETDGLRRRGGPCLQYVQFVCTDAKNMDVLAVYRNHDYCNKALGNFFGLSRLLTFVCGEVGRSPGWVTCLSIHAYFDVSVPTQKILAKL